MSSLLGVAYDFSKVCFTGRLELFQGMSQEAMHRFNAMTRKTKRKRGEWVFVHGDPADSIYFLQKGRMKITALSEEGHEVVHKILGPGEMFGDTSSILGIPRTTSAQTLEDSLLYEIHRKDFESLLTMYPELSLQLLKSVGLRLKKAEDRLLSLCGFVTKILPYMSRNTLESSNSLSASHVFCLEAPTRFARSCCVMFILTA